jgi:MoaA/NifB/PqqE/SkfB family radical SAM enzyme
VRGHGAICTLISNGYLLTPDRIHRLNAAGLDYLQISIDNVQPDDISKKSLKLLDRKLESLARYATFDVTINSVLGGELSNPEDAYQIALRAQQLGFTSTVGVLHDGKGQLRRLDARQRSAYDRIFRLGSSLFTFAHLDAFQHNLIRGLPAQWHCRAGGRFLYICEDGLVHYCSQQRGHPGIPLEQYTQADILRESTTVKECAPFCTISCVHQAAMVDDIRERPRATLAGIIERRKQRDPAWTAPASIRLLEWMFLQDDTRRDRIGALALRLLRARRPTSLE